MREGEVIHDNKQNGVEKKKARCRYKGQCRFGIKCSFEHSEEEKNKFRSTSRNERQQPNRSRLLVDDERKVSGGNKRAKPCTNGATCNFLKHYGCWYYHSEEEIKKAEYSENRSREEHRQLNSVRERAEKKQNKNREDQGDGTKNWRQGMQQSMHSLERTVMDLMKKVGQRKSNHY